jgi:hypothetical protein
MKLGVLGWKRLIASFVFVLLLFAKSVSAQFRWPTDTRTVPAQKLNLPPLNVANRKEPVKISGSLKVPVPPYKQGFFCRFEDKMQMKWKLPLNLELK